MLTQSFIHLPQVGRVTEGEIWDAGIADWDDFLTARMLPWRIRGRDAELRSLIDESKGRYTDRNAAYFDRKLPRDQRWRLYADFRERAAFVDIETTGLSYEHAIITLIGVLDANGYTAYLHGENLADFRQALEQYDLIVTYNGTSFDLPFIEYHFGEMFKNVAHFDLRFPLRRIGFSGGLKSIETQAGVARPSELGTLDGYDAVLLWRLCQQGVEGARETLIRYNAEDVASLPALAEIVYNRLVERPPIDTLGVDCLTPTHRHDIHLPYDTDVIAHTKSMRTRRSWT